MKKLALLALPLLAFTVQPPGWVFQMTTTELATGAVSESQMMVVGNNIKITVAAATGAPEGDMSFLGDVGEIGELIYNNDEDRTYYRINQQLMDDLKAQMGDMEAQMREALAGIPEAQRRAIMERAGGMPGMPGMAQVTPPEIELRSTGERDTKAGYPCVRYELVVDGRVSQHMWMTEWSNVEGAGALGQAFGRFGDFTKAMIESLPFGGMMGDPTGWMARDFRERVAIVTIDLSEAGEPISETVLTDVSRREVALSEFGPKEGYREERMMPGQ